MTTHRTRSRSLPRQSLAPRLGACLAALLVTLVVLAVGASPASAYPPDPPPESTARAQLAALTVEAPGSGSDYDRDLFPHWSTVEGSCDTREIVLERDGVDVVQGSDCGAESGSWYSVYDQATITDSSEVDIDHMVPLSEAWKSGADDWTTDRREDFANDLGIAQLIAVSGSSNSSKGDQDPAEWQPANDGVHCIYAREWIWVKSSYDLSVDAAEVTALEGMLDAC